MRSRKTSNRNSPPNRREAVVRKTASSGGSAASVSKLATVQLPDVLYLVPYSYDDKTTNWATRTKLEDAARIDDTSRCLTLNGKPIVLQVRLSQCELVDSNIVVNKITPLASKVAYVEKSL